jgi:hypothetical protein
VRENAGIEFDLGDMTLLTLGAPSGGPIMGLAMNILRGMISIIYYCHFMVSSLCQRFFGLSSLSAHILGSSLLSAHLLVISVCQRIFLVSSLV